VLSAVHYAAALACYAGRREVFDELPHAGVRPHRHLGSNVGCGRRTACGRSRRSSTRTTRFFAEPEFEFALWDAPDEHLLAGTDDPSTCAQRGAAADVLTAFSST